MFPLSDEITYISPNSSYYYDLIYKKKGVNYLQFHRVIALLDWPKPVSVRITRHRLILLFEVLILAV